MKKVKFDINRNERFNQAKNKLASDSHLPNDPSCKAKGPRSYSESPRAGTIPVKPKPIIVESFKKSLINMEEKFNSYKKEIINQNKELIEKIEENLNRRLKIIDDSLDIIENALLDLTDLNKIKNNKKLYQALLNSDLEAAINKINADLFKVSESQNITDLFYPRNDIWAVKNTKTSQELRSALEALEKFRCEIPNMIKNTLINTIDGKYNDQRTVILSYERAGKKFEERAKMGCNFSYENNKKLDSHKTNSQHLVKIRLPNYLLWRKSFLSLVLWWSFFTKTVRKWLEVQLLKAIRINNKIISYDN
ncbi:unnamed protein product [Blepharisma stoltei]|uniref:Uncharacterized protein n=1 Tax=Blepharisma stoltei TaxID=1481888 RepID=A0AAU9KB92_9CILI|nr:unnamed protein product [Blepharisma stoltei]